MGRFLYPETPKRGLSESRAMREIVQLLILGSGLESGQRSTRRDGYEGHPRSSFPQRGLPK